MFIFYSNFDQTKEPVGKIKADSYEEAVENAAQIKQLSIDSSHHTTRTICRPIL
jgi:hypothetical protein